MGSYIKKIVGVCAGAVLLAAVIIWVCSGGTGKQASVTGTWKGRGVGDTVVLSRDGTYVKTDNYAPKQEGRYRVDKNIPQEDYDKIRTRYANHSYFVNGEYREGQEYEGFYIAFYRDGQDAMTDYGLFGTDGDLKGKLQATFCPSWMIREE